MCLEGNTHNTNITVMWFELGSVDDESAGTPARVREVHWRVRRGVRGMTRQYSVGAGHAVLWYCSWGYTARLGGPPREALYTVALRGER
jgi:hypothetical protein